MAVTTMNLIARQTVGSGGASSVTFSNIPQTFTDLKIVASIRSNYANLYDQLWWSINGTTTTFTGKLLQGSGSAAASYNISSREAGILDAASATASTFGNFEAYIPNYTSSNTKSISIDNVTETNATTIYSQLIAFNWSGTGAITSLGFVSGNSSTFSEFTTFYLYGISNSTTTQASTVPYASGGDVITTDGSYWYHAFKYSGSFTPLKNLTADVLVVAGGGSGGSGNGGGGGAGGIVYNSAQALTSSTNYTCTVGAGGAGIVGRGNNGVNSNVTGGVLSLTAAVGGGTGGDNAVSGNGGNGGSGGGANGATYGTGTAGQGNNGGAGNVGGTQYNWGGGGGAGAAGAAAVSYIAGAGGAGLNTWSSWASATSTGVSGYYGGGGGGGYDNRGSGNTVGAAGAGGGAAGVTGGATANNATANTGGGGGGAGGYNGTDKAGGNGGSGIIIVRYAV